MPVNLSLNGARTRASLVFEHHPGNLLTGEIVGQLHAALTDLDNLPHLKLVTIEGAGADFSFGASVPEHGPEEIARVLPATHALITALLEVPAPTAAVVRGKCLGGGFELALACDFILASDTAMFGLPEIALGVFPPAASVLLPVRAGAARATSAILSGDARPRVLLAHVGRCRDHRGARRGSRQPSTAGSHAPSNSGPLRRCGTRCASRARRWSRPSENSFRRSSSYTCRI